MTTKLTPRVVQQAQPNPPQRPGDPPRARDIRDQELKGLLLRVYPSGRKAFVMDFGHGHRRNIGDAAKLTVKQARITARQWAVDFDSGRLPPAARGKKRSITFGEFVEKQYAPWVETANKSGHSATAALDALFKDDFYGKPLDEITAWQVERFKSARLKAGIAPATVNRDLDRIRSVLSKAVEWERLEANPMRTVKRVKGGDKARVRFLTPDEEDRLRAALAAREAVARKQRASGNAWATARGRTARPEHVYCDHLQPLVLLALNTGLRRGELFGLEWSDIDFRNALLTVRAENAKSQKVRHVPLNVEAQRVLATWRKQSRPRGLVFPSAGGARFTNVNKSWNTLRNAADLPDFRFHDLRHHFASMLAMAGVDLYTIKELLGHADFETTQRYAHLSRNHQADAVAKLDVGRRA
ncbi:tyrosine-type recombinase/integrase [Rhodanobacter lindaniclasticus]